MNFFIATASYYTKLQERLLQGATSYLDENEISFKIGRVSGALELAPLILKASMTKKFDACIALGTVIKGETYHFEIVANQSNSAITKLIIEKNLIIGNGILTCYTMSQAKERSEINKENKGYLAAAAAHNLYLEYLKLSRS